MNFYQFLSRFFNIYITIFILVENIKSINLVGIKFKN
jgi:hypothetical protein